MYRVMHEFFEDCICSSGLRLYHCTPSSVRQRTVGSTDTSNLDPGIGAAIFVANITIWRHQPRYDEY